MKEKILITGATGAVGSELVKQLYTAHDPANITVFVKPSRRSRKLARLYPELNIIYGNICDYDTVVDACKGIDYTIHLAAIIPPLADEKPALAASVNTEGTRNLVRALEKHAPNCFLIYSSSISIYGDRVKDPNIYTTDPLTPSLGDEYALTKIAAEEIIQSSKLDWSIYRLSAIMGIGNHKVSKIMFHMPLETALEITTVRDTARAFVHSIGLRNKLSKRIFNLGGGATCRTSYHDFLQRAFFAFGLGKVDFPENTFAKINFHCGYYADGDELEAILKFRQDTLESYFERFNASVPKAQKVATILVQKPVKWYLKSISEPLEAVKNNDQAMIERYFG